jgi:predicted nucleotide-binding protein (sugar kinase/HSP70/actin superfamily)
MITKNVSVGSPVVAGIPEWIFENISGLRELREKGFVQAVSITAESNRAMQVTARFIPRKPEENKGLT